MKRYIKASASDFEITQEINMKGNRYMVRIGDYEDPLHLRLQITKIAPYDDADYAVAKGTLPQISIYQGGRPIDKMTIWSYEEDDYEHKDEYIDEVIEAIIDELQSINKNVKPKIIHN